MHKNNNTAVIISGTAPNSLGEQITNALAQKARDTTIIAIDRVRNPSLDSIAHFIECDLDVINHPHPPIGPDLRNTILQTQQALKFKAISAVIMSAGTYDYGDFIDTTVESRSRLIGVNIAGKVELLHAVMSANRDLRVDCSTTATLVDIGSQHGLDLPEKRSLYASSKAFGLCLCASLSRGREFERVIHLAPDFIDTGMLHSNHWITKSGGSPRFFQEVSQDPSAYRSIFVDCNQKVALEFAYSLQLDENSFLEAFGKYSSKRTTLRDSPDGILSAVDVGSFVVRLLSSPNEYSNGLYRLFSKERKLECRYSTFEDLISCGRIE